MREGRVGGVGLCGSRGKAVLVTEEMAQVIALLEAPPPGLRSCPADRCACVLGVSGVGVTVGAAGGGELVWRSDEVALALDELQFTVGEGPCVEAAAGTRVFEADLAGSAPARWPGFAAAALELGVRAVFALPLAIGPIHFGVFELHRDRPGALTGDALGDALAFAQATSVTLAESPAAQTLASGLDEPVAGRRRVHQAAGMISVQADISVAEALVRLRAYAYSRSRPVSEVAGDVVERRLRFDGES